MGSELSYKMYSQVVFTYDTFPPVSMVLLKFDRTVIGIIVVQYAGSIQAMKGSNVRESASNDSGNDRVDMI